MKANIVTETKVEDATFYSRVKNFKMLMEIGEAFTIPGENKTPTPEQISKLGTLATGVLFEWKNVLDLEDKPLTCNQENKELFFVAHLDIMLQILTDVIASRGQSTERKNESGDGSASS